MDRDANGYIADSEAAHLRPVTAEVHKVANAIAEIAAGLLEDRHDMTDVRFHNLPKPQIKVSKWGSTDYNVVLEARGYDNRAIGIEYGHRYESKEDNASGPWNESEGLHVLDDASLYISIFYGW